MKIMKDVKLKLNYICNPFSFRFADNTSLRSSDTQLHQTSSMEAPEGRRRGKSSGIKHSNSGTSDKSGNSSDRGERSERGERSSNLGKKSSSTSQLSATGRS